MDTPPISASWIAVDWGTSQLRAWAMDANAQVLASCISDRGMGHLTPGAFEGALLDTVGAWLNGPTTVLACGMLGSRQGWVEAPYHTVPCAPLPGGFARPIVKDPRLDVHVIPGLKQTKPADVMRGEETQIAGFLTLNPKFDGIICLPGTHTKWAHVSADEVVSFQTFMTGELFSVLADATVLRHTVASGGWDDVAFQDALSETLSRPERLAALLFSLRAESLIDNLTGQTARARLSGLLVGAELAAARPYWLGQEIAVLGAPEISRAYQSALMSQGITPIIAEGTQMTLAGLTAAHSQLVEA